ncbi:MAG: hypothetical protein HY951_01120 [Bacteroidia bacterium]|nr:hypothetical protein [Bacteroidia bacterium]
MKIKLIAIVIIITIVGGIVGVLVSLIVAKPERRDFLIKARQYSYEPDRIEVNYNDTLHIRLISMDVVHGFYLENYDIDAEISPNIKSFKVRKPSLGYNWKDTSEIVVIANQRGKFRFRCSHTCGNMHPFMQGILIVKPNMMLFTSIGIILGLLIGLLLMFYLRIRNK